MQRRSVLWFGVALWLALSAFLLIWAMRTASAAPRSDKASEVLAEQVREVLRQNPELVLDILREHSEAVLDIAQQGANQRRGRALTLQWRKDMETPKDVNLKDRPMRGASNAPVTIVAYSDFTCPYCEQGSATVKRILADYPGKVRYVFKAFPLENQGTARLAAEYHLAAAMQSADKAWALYDNLFDRRDELIKKGEPLLKEEAARVGLDMKRLAADLRGKAVKDQLEEDLAEGVRLGVQGTPYFLVNNIMVRGALSPELFADAVNMALEEAGAKPR